MKRILHADPNFIQKYHLLAQKLIDDTDPQNIQEGLKIKLFI